MQNEEQLNSEEEINRKRKNNPNFQVAKRFAGVREEEEEEEEEENDFLALKLAIRPQRPCRLSPIQQPLSPSPPPPPPPAPPLFPQSPLQLSPSHPLYMPPFTTDSSTPTPMVYRQEGAAASSRPLRMRRNPTQAPRDGKSDTVPALFPWATTHRATVYSMEHLLSNGIFTITGDVQCKRCEHQYQIDYDLREKFLEVGSFIDKNKSSMHDRAPSVWMNPILPTCKLCAQENCVKPIIAEKKKSINWLFLLLGQMLGCCTLEQLKYFCKHTKNHRTGAKDRVLYLTYLGLCKQLDPNGPFDR
ncbi:hypothetical protein L1049_015893 [Liquidambar formosana]|uniref:DUF7086 domain-containing protein n=1 Tax=Liquidambar formosana TaxID=63359 RepID=A0AAP0RYT7_LIQFO